MPEFRILALLPLVLSAPVAAESFLDLDFGLAPTRSVLGVAYTQGRNQLSVGLKDFRVGTSGYALSPGLSYNRYLTGNGFYASLSYAAVDRNEETTVLRFAGPGPNDYTVESLRLKGWEAGWVYLGGGKSFQFTRWGIHLDGGFVTPAGEEFARSWGYWIGLGGSYRFRLD